MNHNTEKTDGSYPIDLYADLRLICDAGSLDIRAHDGRAVFLHFSSLRVAFAFLRMLKGIDSFSGVLKTVDQALKRVDVTLFWQSSRLPILGTNTKPFLLLALIVIQRISKLIPFHEMKLR